MNRYIVIGENNVICNVIVWDGETKWTPPAGCRVEKNHDAAMGDIWHEELNDFVRPVSLIKIPEDEVSVDQRKKEYEKQKDKFKRGVAFLNLEGNVDA